MKKNFTMASNCVKDDKDVQLAMNNKEIHLIHSKKVKSQLQEVFREMAEKISHANFEAIFKHLKDADIIIQNEEQLVETFRAQLHRKITYNLNDMWHQQDIDVKLTTLNFCKEKCKDNTTSWRPTGKTPEEQTKYLRIHHLKKKIEYLQHVIDYQQKSFDKIYHDVEEKRARIQKIINTRDDISKQMTLRMEQINAEDNVYEELQRKLCE